QDLSRYLSALWFQPRGRGDRASLLAPPDPCDDRETSVPRPSVVGSAVARVPLVTGRADGELARVVVPELPNRRGDAGAGCDRPVAQRPCAVGAPRPAQYRLLGRLLQLAV